MRWDAKWVRIAALLTLYVALFWLGGAGGGWLARQLGFDPDHGNLVTNHGAIWIGLAAYGVLLAIPSVPGMEISLGLFAMFGSAVALPVYCTTVVALICAYVVGRTVPARFVSGLFRAVGLHQAEHFIQRLEPLDAQGRLATLMENAPRRFVPFLIRHRYVAVAVAFNVPGNAVLGGGGGIALLAGLSGLFSPLGFVIAVCIAVLPVPLTALVGGKLF